MQAAGLGISEKQVNTFIAEACDEVNDEGDRDGQLDYTEYLLLVRKITEWKITRLEFYASFTLLLVGLIGCSIAMPIENEGWGAWDGFYFCIITWMTIVRPWRGLR